MTNMLTALRDATNVGYTANGARAYRTTNSDVLDFFGIVGSARNLNDYALTTAFSKAIGEDRLLAMKALFYGYDVRGGQGERNTFARLVKWLVVNKPELVALNAHLIPEYGRWDMLYVLFDTTLEDVAAEIIKKQFLVDLESGHPSLLGKWLKSENASSTETRRLARKTRKHLGLSSKAYRKALSTLRERINVVERLMSAGEWDKIDFEKVPSKASLIYSDAFDRHRPNGYTAFINDVENGKAKINAGTLFPYELVRRIPSRMESIYRGKYNIVYDASLMTDKDTVNALWNAQPDYFGGRTDNALVMLDVSYSMRGLPAEIALGLSIYAAERNRGEFHNHILTFSERPDLVKLQGETFVEKVCNISRAYWDLNTNIEAAFDLILNTAINKRIPADEMVSRVYIISDMQFDRAVDGGNDKALFENLRQRYESAGYAMPDLVFWNVNASAGNTPLTFNDAGVQLVSGASPTIFTNLLAGRMKTAYEMMLDVLESDRYAAVRA